MDYILKYFIPKNELPRTIHDISNPKKNYWNPLEEIIIMWSKNDDEKVSKKSQKCSNVSGL